VNPTEPKYSTGLSDRTKNMLVIVGTLGAIIIGALLIYGILVTPAREPYREALAQYQNVARTNGALTAAGANLNANTASDEQFTKNIEMAQKALASVKTENNALGKESVLTNGEGKAYYDAFNKKLQTYLAYNDNVLTSMLKVRPVLYKCNQQMEGLTESEESVAALRVCAQQFGDVKDVPDRDYQALAASFDQGYVRLASILEDIVALKEPKGADKGQYDALVGQRTEAIETLSTISGDFSGDVRDHRNAVSVTNVSDTLENYLEAKSRVF
jgi:hypothetical protein